jgi:hypothetical protein
MQKEGYSAYKSIQPPHKQNPQSQSQQNQFKSRQQQQQRSQLQSQPQYPQQGNNTLNDNGSQMLSYQLYQQAINAATPTVQQLNAISGQSHEQTGAEAVQLGGGLTSEKAPYASLGGNEFQTVNIGSERSQNISVCAQNIPTFIASSLLPKPTVSGQQSWDINAPDNILASQNFLSAVQQIGVDTTLSSRKNQSHDIRSTIPNPIGVVSPWNNTDISPDLERRPLECYNAQDQGLYGCSSPSAE